MRIAMHICPTKFLYARKKLRDPAIRILDVGCGNNSPSTTKRWFPGCHYSGADIESYNLTDEDSRAMDDFYPLGPDGSGYSAVPNDSYDFVILHHVLEHMRDPTTTLSTICSKLKPGGYIWIAFPSLRSLSLPSAEGTLQFCDDPTHIYVPHIREVSNVLLTSGVRVLHAGRSRDLVRELIGAVLLPWALLKRGATGKLSSRGLWYILGFEDHVFGQRT
jgi:2-polyprenyl-3-methyl-5-hydroxy-6-metoxy-1,4-benzoquinol methylase